MSHFACGLKAVSDDVDLSASSTLWVLKLSTIQSSPPPIPSIKTHHLH